MTVKNEQASIKPLMDSLLGQSRTPDEIVVDGGSSDRKVHLL
jgi:glycosyltransferase involved in cell wall biosynthesis